MNKLFILLKANIINSLGINNIKNIKYCGVKKVFVLFSFLISIIAIGALVILYASGMAIMLKQFGMMDLILVLAVFMSVLFAFFTSIYKAQGVLFSYSDFENLIVLPIKSSVILASKMIELLLLNYLFTTLILIPTSIVYFKNVNISPLFFVFMIVAILFIPLIPIVVASIFAFGLRYISSKTRYKNMFLNILSILFLVIFMMVSFKISDILNYIITNSKSITEVIIKIYPLAYYYANALANLNIISLLKLIIWSIIPFGIFIVVFAKGFKAINLKLSESYKKSNYEMTSLITLSPSVALLKKEIKRYFSSSVYMMNTSVGIILVIILAVVTVFIGSEGMINLMLQSGDKDVYILVNMFSDFLQFVPLIIISFGVGLSCTTGSSISLEGKNIWILKSSPIRTEDIFKGKIGLNLIILIPSIAVSTMLFWIGFELTFINAIWTFLIPILLAVLVSISGLIVNLYFPNLDYKNETQVVKQSLSSFISMFLGIVLVAITIGICYLSIKYLHITNIYVYLGGIAALLIVLDIVLVIILKTKGENLFNKLSC